MWPWISGEIPPPSVSGWARSSRPTNRRQLWIPEGFAHGFLTLSPQAQVLYKTTNYHAPEAEGCLIYDDPQVDIPWPPGLVELSQKDARGIRLSEIYGDG